MAIEPEHWPRCEAARTHLFPFGRVYGRDSPNGVAGALALATIVTETGSDGTADEHPNRNHFFVFSTLGHTCHYRQWRENVA